MSRSGIFVVIFLVMGCSVPGHVISHGPVKFLGAMPATDQVIVYEGEGREFISNAVVAAEYEHRWILDGKKVEETMLFRSSDGFMSTRYRIHPTKQDVGMHTLLIEYVRRDGKDAIVGKRWTVIIRKIKDKDKEAI